MADQITEVATRRGNDVRDFTLVAGGGAGPVHAATIADLLHIPRVVIPPIAATYSAFGMFAMDVGRNFARSYIARAAELDVARVETLYAEMEREAVAGFAGLGVPEDEVAFQRTADLRYVGQFHEVEVDVPAGGLSDAAIDESVANFHAGHEELYAFAMPFQAVEFLTFRLRATTARAPVALRRLERGDGDPERALKRRRSCRFGGSDLEVPVYDGERLRAGDTFDGPAIVEETTTTVVVPERYRLTVDEDRNYVLTRRPLDDQAAPSRLAEALAGAGAAS
jgi:N-methylhydantoinase A